MPSGNYRFSRKHNSLMEFMSSNRPSTDALNALGTWSNGQPQRSFTPLVDEDDQLLACLYWSENDISAGPDLESACTTQGIERSYVPT